MTFVAGGELGDDPPVVEVDGHGGDQPIHHVMTRPTRATIAGVRRRDHVVFGADTIAVDSPLGSSEFLVVDRLPVPAREGDAGSQTAPMPGSVVRILAEVGQHVEAGQPLVVLEAMKMEHTLTSPQAGVVVAVHVTSPILTPRRASRRPPNQRAKPRTLHATARQGAPNQELFLVWRVR